MAIAPKLTIPTGYESEQRAIERRRKIAEALLQQGLQSNPNMTSPWQAIAQVANAFVGRRMEKKADQRSDALSGKIKGDFDAATTEFNNDAAMLQPSQLVAKYRNNPMMAENLKPYEAALQRALTEREALTTFNGKMQRQGDVVGQYDQGKPTDMIRRDATGNEFLNPMAVDAAAIQAGNSPQFNSVEGYATGQTAAPRKALPKEGDPGVVGIRELQAAVTLQGPEGAKALLEKAGSKVLIRTPEEWDLLPKGTSFIRADGLEGVKQ